MGHDLLSRFNLETQFHPAARHKVPRDHFRVTSSIRAGNQCGVRSLSITAARFLPENRD